MGDLEYLKVRFTAGVDPTVRSSSVVLEDGYTTTDDIPKIIATTYYGRPELSKHIHVLTTAPLYGER